MSFGSLAGSGEGAGRRHQTLHPPLSPTEFRNSETYEGLTTVPNNDEPVLSHELDEWQSIGSSVRGGGVKQRFDAIPGYY
jgi:hypothetical protein